MNEFLVYAVTAIPVAIFGAIGYRVGGRRLFARGVSTLIPSALGLFVAAWGFRNSLFEPIGLVTPILLGFLAMVVGWRGFRWVLVRIAFKRRSASARSWSNRIAGAHLGGCVGFVVATTFWLVSPVVAGFWSSAPRTVLASQPAQVDTESSSEGFFGSLMRTANRGFLRHLPVVGPISDEMEAVIYILNAPIEDRREFAENKDWDQLAELPSYRAIMESDEIFGEIDAVGEHDLVALYRLQKNPLVIAFFEEDAVRDLLGDLRVTAIAADLEQLQSSRAPVQGEGP